MITSIVRDEDEALLLAGSENSVSSAFNALRQKVRGGKVKDFKVTRVVVSF
jgi:hypothetical protein